MPTTERKPRRIIESFLDAMAEVTVEDSALRNVALLGPESVNGYHYTQEAMEAAVPLYEGRPVFLNHPDPSTPKKRRVQDYVGKIENTRMEGGRIRGDIKLAGPNKQLVAELAESNPAEIGMSHVIFASDRKSGNDLYIDSIKSVLSVDVVAFPATTRNFAEQQGEGDGDKKPTAEATYVPVDPPVGSFEDIREQILKLVPDYFTAAGVWPEPEEDKDNVWHSVEFTFPNRVVISIQSGPTESHLYQVGYFVDTEGIVTLTGDPQELQVSLIAASQEWEVQNEMDKEMQKELMESRDEARSRVTELEGQITTNQKEHGEAIARLEADFAELKTDRDLKAGELEKLEAQQKLAIHRESVTQAIEVAKLPEVMKPSEAQIKLWVESGTELDVIQEDLKDRADKASKVVPPIECPEKDESTGETLTEGQQTSLKDGLKKAIAG